MLIAAVVVLLIGAAGYFVSVGKKLQKMDAADRALDAVENINKMETAENERTRRNLNGNADDSNSIAVQFPGVSNVARKRRRSLSDLSSSKKPDA